MICFDVQNYQKERPRCGVSACACNAFFIRTRISDEAHRYIPARKHHRTPKAQQNNNNKHNSLASISVGNIIDYIYIYHIIFILSYSHGHHEMPRDGWLWKEINIDAFLSLSLSLFSLLLLFIIEHTVSML